MFAFELPHTNVKDTCQLNSLKFPLIRLIVCYQNPRTQASFPWREIPRDRLTLGKILGEGEFGMVVKGELTEDDGHITPCAVKKLKGTCVNF